MLQKIGLFVVVSAGFVVTVLTVALAATSVVLGLEKLYHHYGNQQAADSVLANGTSRYYQPKDVNGNPSVQADGKPLLLDRCSIEDLKGNPVFNPDCPVGTVDHLHQGQYTAAAVDSKFEKYKVNETKSTVVVHESTIEFPAGMTDDAIAQAIKKSFPAGIKYDIQHHQGQHTAADFLPDSQNSVAQSWCDSASKGQPLPAGYVLDPPPGFNGTVYDALAICSGAVGKPKPYMDVTAHSTKGSK